MDNNEIPLSIRTRREAREVALQCLYAQEFSQENIETIFSNIVREDDASLFAFCKELISRTILHKDELDKIIKVRLENWDLDRIATLDKLILRIAICEFIYFEEIPTAVTINEAIEIAKKFSTEKSSAFVNGILDSSLIDLKKQGKIIKSGKGLIDSETIKSIKGKK
jgi:N utilization substance protein B